MNANELVTQPLRLQTGQTTLTPLTDIQSLTACLTTYLTDPANIVVWQYDRIRWGRWQDGVLTLADGSPLRDEYVLEARCFNAERELHLLRRHGLYQGRLLDDTTGPVSEYVDSASRLWGKRSGVVQQGFVELKDTERFLRLVVPVSQTSDYYALVTRNYVTANAITGQSGYSDYRYVAIEAVKGGI